MSTQSLLEIVIPTYNRADILSASLKELCPIIGVQSSEISLRVIDNCSTDSTREVVKPYLDKGLISYECNQSNIGLIRNIAKSINTSSAKWTWVLGDDDHVILHSLPFLLSALKTLDDDTVFARARCITVAENGSISSVETINVPAVNSINYYSPGIGIAECGSIHSLAFISQLIINPALWDQNYHDSIYSESDLYTFVLTLLHSCLHRKSASLELHITAGTDRGDRSYYTSNMCIARLTEYTEYERFIHEQFGKRMARKVLSRSRNKMLSLRIASCLKFVSHAGDYRIRGRDPISFMSSYSSPYLRDVVVVRAIAMLSKLPLGSIVIKNLYSYFSKKR